MWTRSFVFCPSLSLRKGRKRTNTIFMANNAKRQLVRKPSMNSVTTSTLAQLLEQSGQDGVPVVHFDQDKGFQRLMARSIISDNPPVIGVIPFKKKYPWALKAGVLFLFSCFFHLLLLFFLLAIVCLQSISQRLTLHSSLLMSTITGCHPADGGRREGLPVYGR